MAEQADMDTIAALLGNLIERVEKIEEEQSKTAGHLEAMHNFVSIRDEKDTKFREAIINCFKSDGEKLDNLANLYMQERRGLTGEDVNARRHGEINEWTGDHSRQLSEMRVVLDRAISKKKGIFS